jgi:hypothetical protein
MIPENLDLFKQEQQSKKLNNPNREINLTLNMVLIRISETEMENEIFFATI